MRQFRDLESIRRTDAEHNTKQTQNFLCSSHRHHSSSLTKSIMQKLRDFIQRFKTSDLKPPSQDELKKAIQSFSRKWLVVFVSLFLILLVSTFLILGKINQTFMIEIPTQGGAISEGVIDAPRFVNPILALSDTDKDLTTLVYSGLMRKMPDGRIIKDLAKDYEISEDGLTYTFTLKDNIFFHDGKPVTTQDIVFTINMARDPILKSPKRISWEGVATEELDEKTIEFTLKQPYASFLENATLGILPYHIWKDISVEQFSFSDFNIQAVGSGPYKIDKIKKRSSGVLEYYELVPFRKFVLGRAFIDKITIRFYSNEKELLKAFNTGEVEHIGAITPKEAEILRDKNYRVETTVLPRIFGLFFNQNQATIFTDKQIIKAFDKAIDKERIVREVLYGYADVIDSPIPKNILGHQIFVVEQSTVQDTEAKSPEAIAQSGEAGFREEPEKSRTEEAIEILEKAGWERGDGGIMEKNGKKLEFSIATSDAPELKQAAKFIKEDLGRIGALVELKIFEIGNLNQNVIRPRKYDVLFFGQIISNESDLFAFWHSSQRNDPGLNIALYTNTKVDKLLEEALTTLDEKERIKKYIQFEEEIKKDVSTIFVYSPEFIYVVLKHLKGLNISRITTPPERFLGAHTWYTETEKIWRVFSKFK